MSLNSCHSNQTKDFTSFQLSEILMDIPNTLQNLSFIRVNAIAGRGLPLGIKCKSKILWWSKLIGYYEINSLKNHKNAIILKFLKLQLFDEGI